MSISGALSNALTGLTAAARSTEVVSSNIANALTEGYGRRQLNLSARTLGANGTGVRVDGVTRLVDDVVIADRRLADASIGDSSTRANFLRQIEKAIGSPEDPGSLSDRIAKLEGALLEAGSRPDSTTRLATVLQSAKSLVAHIKGISDKIQTLRMDSDHMIGKQVDHLNDTLGRIEQLNADIVAQRGAGHDANGLLDQRQKLVDSISSIIPLRQVPRENGKIALITEGGAILLDGPAATLGFSAVGVIVPEMTLGSGALSGLTINGRPVETAGRYSPIRGGSLAALFATRDDIAVSAQGDLDAFSRDLVERFQDPAVDPSLAPGAAGLFTDAGAAFNPSNEMALSSRLGINTAVDPSAGGELRRLRDGIASAVPGDVGNAALLHSLSSALSRTRVPVSGSFGASSRSTAALGADFLSNVSGKRQSAESRSAFEAARRDALKSQELASGVDTDQELQQLLLVEHAYAANARVIQTADSLIQQILGI